MPIDYTTTALVDSVKRRITVPTSQNFFLPSNIIDYANDEMHSTIVPAIVSVREEFFVTSADITIDPNVNEYRIPTRAVGGMLRDVVLIDSNGNEVAVTRLSPETVKSINSLVNPQLSGIIVKDDTVVLWPSAQSFTQVTLRMKFMRRPNNLIQTSQAGRILNINTGTNEVTLTNAPGGWSATTTFDVIRDVPLFTSVQDDQTITNISGAVLTFSSLPANMAVGNWVAESTLTPVPQIPYEAHKVLAQFTAGRMLNSTGDKKNGEVILDVAKQMLESLTHILTPRIEGTHKKINSRGGIFNWVSSAWYDMRS